MTMKLIIFRNYLRHSSSTGLNQISFTGRGLIINSPSLVQPNENEAKRLRTPTLEFSEKIPSQAQLKSFGWKFIISPPTCRAFQNFDERLRQNSDLSHTIFCFRSDFTMSFLRLKVEKRAKLTTFVIMAHFRV